MTYRVEPTDKALVDAGEAYFWINEGSGSASLVQGADESLPAAGNKSASLSARTVERAFRRRDAPIE